GRASGGILRHVWSHGLVVLLSRRVCTENYAAVSLSVTGVARLGHLRMDQETRSKLPLDARAVSYLYAVRARQPHRHRRALLSPRVPDVYAAAEHVPRINNKR